MIVENFEPVLRRAVQGASETLRVNWHLGLTAFGGPPVHFKIFHDKFVKRLKWIDEQIYQELFSVSQALCGPASTKMLYCINLIHGGVASAIFSFFLWCLPGAVGMLGLSIGVSNVGETLPRPVYSLLSGLNAATVGIITLAAVELSDKAVTDKLTRVIVFLTASAGMLYNALWYFPVLVFSAGCATVVHDHRWVHRPVRAAWSRLRPGRNQRQQQQQADVDAAERASTVSTPAMPLHSPQPATSTSADGLSFRRDAIPSSRTISNDDRATGQTGTEAEAEAEPRVIPQEYRLNMSWKTGIAIIAAFFATFITVMVLRGTLSRAPPPPPFLFRLFANMYLAGTIIFGGGPVVIPLLREYVVAEGWVSPRDFLVGLAVAQAFPGPNFNFAVFLGGLAAVHQGAPLAAGAVVAFLAIFAPGLVLVHGTMGVWGGGLRNRRWVQSAVRGLNAGAVGLVYTAVYRIWQVGYVDIGFQSGRSLGDDPWWVVVAASAYVGGRYFSVVPPIAIVLGSVLGLVRYGVVSR